MNYKIDKFNVVKGKQTFAALTAFLLVFGALIGVLFSACGGCAASGTQSAWGAEFCSEQPRAEKLPERQKRPGSTQLLPRLKATVQRP